MRILLPDKTLLQKTGSIDYFDWNYKFPISLVQQYRFKKIISLLNDTKYNTLLEIGTGSGIFLPELAKHCDSIYACDIHNNFDHISKLCDYYGIQDYNLATQNIEKTDYGSNFFDIIIGVSVLEFVNDLPSAIKEIKRILKKDGIFITICPMENKFLDLILSAYSSKTPKDEFGESRQLVAKSLERSFEVVKRGYMNPVFGKYFPIYTYYKLKNSIIS